MNIHKKQQCFVCKLNFEAENLSINQKVNLPVCIQCEGTEKEKMEVTNLLDSLAEDLVCGCI